MLREAFHLLGVAPIASVCLYRGLTLSLNARSWQVLLPPERRPSFPTLLRLRWIGESINGLLPVGQVGGDLARARLVAARGVRPAEAAASMVADLGTGIVTQVVFGLAAALALARARGPGRPAGASAALPAELGVAALAVLGFVALYVLFFRMGAARALVRRLGPAARRRWATLAGGLERFDEAAAALFSRERVLSSAGGWHLAGWLSQVGETWLALALFGAPVSLSAALAIEGVAAAARGAAFFVPAGLGVQEASVVSLARLVGVGLEPALALGILKRARELLVGLPGLVAWAIEERRAWPRRRTTDG